jgi:hypothetical protein
MLEMAIGTAIHGGRAEVAAIANEVEPVVDIKTKLAERANARIEEARSFRITDAKAYQRAAELLLAIKALRSEADQAFDPIIADAHKAHKTALAQKAKVDGPLAEAEVLYKAAMGTYETEQRRLRQAEERRLSEEAESLAAIEREQEIEEAEAAGATAEEVKVMAEAPLQIAPVVVTPNVQRIPGITKRELWKWEVTNKQALDQFIAANPQYSNLTTPNAVAIGGLARSLKSAMKIPGIHVWDAIAVSARRS